MKEPKHLALVPTYLHTVLWDFLHSQDLESNFAPFLLFFRMSFFAHTSPSLGESLNWKIFTSHPFPLRPFYLQLEGGDDSAALQLQSWLRKTASAHQTLLALAKKEKITVPELEDEDEQTSHVASNESIMWGNYIMIGAKDWDDDLALGSLPNHISL